MVIIYRCLSSEITSVVTALINKQSVDSAKVGSTLFVVNNGFQLQNELKGSLTDNLNIQRLTRKIFDSKPTRNALKTHMESYDLCVVTGIKLLEKLSNGQIQLENIENLIILNYENILDHSHAYAEIFSAVGFLKSERRAHPKVIGICVFGETREEDWRQTAARLAVAGRSPFLIFSSTQPFSTHGTMSNIPAAPIAQTIHPTTTASSNLTASISVFKRFKVRGQLFPVNSEVFALFIDWLVFELQEKMLTHATDDVDVLWIDADPELFSEMLEIIQTNIDAISHLDSRREALLSMAIHFKMNELVSAIRDKMAKRAAILSKYSDQDYVEFKCQDGFVSMAKQMVLDTSTLFNTIFLDDKNYRNTSGAPYIHLGKKLVMLLVNYVEGREVILPNNIESLKFTMRQSQDFKISGLEELCKKKLEALLTNSNGDSQMIGSTPPMAHPSLSQVTQSVVPGSPSSVRTVAIVDASPQQNQQAAALTFDASPGSGEDVQGTDGQVQKIAIELEDGSIQQLSSQLLGRHPETEKALLDLPTNQSTGSIIFGYGLQQFNVHLNYLKF